MLNAKHKQAYKNFTNGNQQTDKTMIWINLELLEEQKSKSEQVFDASFRCTFWFCFRSCEHFVVGTKK